MFKFINFHVFAQRASLHIHLAPFHDEYRAVPHRQAGKSDVAAADSAPQYHGFQFMHLSGNRLHIYGVLEFQALDRHTDIVFLQIVRRHLVAVPEHCTDSIACVILYADDGDFAGGVVLDLKLESMDFGRQQVGHVLHRVERRALVDHFLEEIHPYKSE